MSRSALSAPNTTETEPGEAPRPAGKKRVGRIVPLGNRGVTPPGETRRQHGNGRVLLGALNNIAYAQGMFEVPLFPAIAITTDDIDQPDVQQARFGDMDATKRLYLRHRPRILNLIRLMLGNASDSEDVCHDTFLRAFSALKNFREETRFSIWLCRIAINQCHNWRARNRTRQRFTISESEAVDSSFAGGDSRSIANRSPMELRLALQHAIHQLSAGQQEVFLCHDVLGMNHEEIAFIMDCAVGTSKTQLHKARLRLRALLTEGRSNEMRS